MGNLLRSDFYRLFKSKSFYICALISSFLFGLNLFITYWASRSTPQMKEVYASMLPKNGIAYGLSAFANGNVQMILGIVIAIFVTAEFSHGTMKNVVSKGFSKVQIYFSKFITMLAATYMIILVTFLAGTLIATFTSGKFGDFSSDNIALIFKTVGIELLLNAALTALLVFVAMVVRNLGGVIAINILGVMSFGPLIFKLFEYLTKSKIKFTEFSLNYNIAHYITETVKASDYLRSTIVGLVFFAVATALGIFAFLRADVK